MKYSTNTNNNIFNIGYYSSSSDWDNSNDFNLSLGKHNFTWRLPNLLKGYPGEYGSTNCSVYSFTINPEHIHFNFGKGRYKNFEYPWNLQYVEGSKQYVDVTNSYGVVNIDLIDDDSRYNWDWTGGIENMFQFYSIVDPCDNERIKIKTHLCVRQYTIGNDLFSKIIHLFKPIIKNTRLLIDFETGFGERKYTGKNGWTSISEPLTDPNLTLSEAVMWWIKKENITECTYEN